MKIKLSLWDRLRGVKGYTMEVNTHKGWVPLHPNKDGSPYLCSKEHAEENFENLAMVQGTEVRVVAYKGAKR